MVDVRAPHQITGATRTGAVPALVFITPGASRRAWRVTSRQAVIWSFEGREEGGLGARWFFNIVVDAVAEMIW